MEHSGFEGAVAFVTGAAGGIGAAVARHLAGLGARVAAADRDAAALRVAVGQEPTDHELNQYELDVRDGAAVADVLRRVETELGPVRVVVNVAGVLPLGRVVELTDQQWATAFEVNTHGVFNVCRAAARLMIPRRAGCIVTVSSNAAYVPRVGMAAYAASKAAATALTRCLGLELAEYGIRCNVVSPGSTDTPMLHSMWSDPSGRAATIAGSPADFRLGIPLGKLATPEDIAAAVAFLASDRAGHITLHDLCVDGGAALGA